MRALYTIILATLVAIPACSQEGVVGSLKGSSSGQTGAEGDDPASVAAPGSGPTVADTTISAGGASTCVRSSAGDVRCWGENSTGSLGIGNEDPAESAKPVEPSKLGLVTALFAGEQAHCAMRADGKVFCWGTIAVAFAESSGDVSPMSPMPIMNPFSIDNITGKLARVAIGRHFMCTLGLEGDVRCFGFNQKGQLGLGNTDSQHLPTTVKGFDGAVVSLSASMGGVFVCAATNTGAVYCWGDNAKGQIGAPGQGGSVLEPRRIEGLPGKAVEVVAGGAHACARLDSGKVACWGEGGDGQLGDGKASSSATPVATEILTDVVGLAAGSAHTCAVRSEGAVFCWGSDKEGQAGKIPEGKRPWVVVEASFKAKSVTCGLSHTCAWGAGGRVQCWGSDARAQLGPVSATF